MWVLLSHPLRSRLMLKGYRFQPMLVDESVVPTALSQGWQVIARERDIVPAETPVLQRNPNRLKSHGYGAVDDGA